MKILIIDDDEVLRNEFRELLESEGHEVSVAIDGERGVEAARAHPFDLVFTDLKMPGISGIDVIRELTASNPRTFLVMVTGYATVETAIEAMRIGVFDYVQKPFRIERIRAILESIREAQAYRRQVEAGRGDEDDDLFSSLEFPEAGMLIFTADPKTPGPARLIKSGAEAIDLGVGGDLSPKQLYDLRVAAVNFLNNHRGAVVVLENLGLLRKEHSWEGVRRFLETVRDEVVKTNGRLIVGNDPTGWSDPELDQLTELLSFHYVKLISESVASPIRRRILRYLAAEGTAHFNEIHAHLELNDTPKLSFHLRKLLKEDLLAKDETKVYSLTHLGTRIDGSLHDMEVDGTRAKHISTLITYTV